MTNSVQKSRIDKNSIDPANFICGIFLIVVGGFFIWQSLGLDIGTAFRMGPGYFPLVLAIILVVLGGIVLLQSFRKEGEPIGALAWRGMLFILPAPIFFGLTVRGLGFNPSLFFTCLIASFASIRMNLITAIILSAVLTAFSVVVFSYGLNLPFQRFGPWWPF